MSAEKIQIWCSDGPTNFTSLPCRLLIELGINRKPVNTRFTFLLLSVKRSDETFGWYLNGDFFLTLSFFCDFFNKYIYFVNFFLWIFFILVVFFCYFFIFFTLVFFVIFLWFFCDFSRFFVIFFRLWWNVGSYQVRPKRLWIEHVKSSRLMYNNIEFESNLLILCLKT